MKASVILITYNHERYLAQAIESVMHQVVDFDFELLISEDRSTDGTWAIAERFEQQRGDGQPSVRTFRSEENLNTNEVFTRAYQRASGEYIAVFDGDDFWAPDKLRTQVDFLDAHPETPGCFHAVNLEPELPLTPTSERIAGLEQWYDLGDDLRWVDFPTLTRGNVIAGPSVLYRRSALGAIPAWYLGLPFGDYPLHLLAAESGALAYLPAKLATYRVHAAGKWSGMESFARIDHVTSMFEAMLPQFTGSKRRALKRGIREQQRARARALLDLGRRREAWREYLVVPPTSSHELQAHLRLGLLFGPPPLLRAARQLRASVARRGGGTEAVRS